MSKILGETNDIAELGDMLQRLRAADSSFRGFGSTQHRYSVGPILSERVLAAFESANRIRLPSDYRPFLALVGNGGAGPFYGLAPLNADGQDLSRPFPFTMATDAFADEELQRLLDNCVGYPGILEGCHHGCAVFSCLVVNGPAYGTIWDGREDFYPTELTFGMWYRRWLERALRVLDNERLILRLRVGMKRADVLAEVGGDWRARPALGQPMQYFESEDIPAQLVLNERLSRLGHGRSSRLVSIASASALSSTDDPEASWSALAPSPGAVASLRLPCSPPTFH